MPGVNSEYNMLSRDWGERVTTSRVLRQHRVSCLCNIFLFCWIGGAVGLLFLFRDRVPLKTPVGDGEKKRIQRGTHLSVFLDFAAKVSYLQICPTCWYLVFCLL